MIYGYARVSTKGQAKDGNSLDDQRIKPGDTVTVTKLDRLARSASKGVELVNIWLKDGITVHILNMGLINNTPYRQANHANYVCVCEIRT